MTYIFSMKRSGPPHTPTLATRPTQPVNSQRFKITATSHTTIQRQIHSDTTYKHSTSKSQRHHMQPFDVKVRAAPYAAIRRQSQSDTTCKHSTSMSQRDHMPSFDVKVTSLSHAVIRHQRHSDTRGKRSTSKSRRYRMRLVTVTVFATLPRRSHADIT